ncbi:glycoprotein Xg isoform X2 [Lagenorhynchus albirostris]|uniref:glycoprotein Xg isoform X2 n=1 Tax=Lagenorhynchus albirostris TaxID=27610 RepID=UPI0028EA4292|nr:glycoprotein Xg isoform X2 [Lagenorhynchus albirostris]
MSLYSDRCLGALLGLALASPCRRLLGKDPRQGVSCLHPGLAPLMLVHLPCPREADPGHPLVRGSHLFPQHPEAGWQRSAGRRAPRDALQHIRAHASRAPGRAVWDGTPSPSASGRGTPVWFILSAWRHCLFPLQTGKQKSAHPSSEGGVAGSPSARPEGSPERKPRMEPWWGLFHLTFLCSLMHVRGQGDFDLADALDDPEPTKKPSSDTYPKPTPPHQPQPGNPNNSGSKKVHSFQSTFDERYLSKAKATATSPAWQL